MLPLCKDAGSELKKKTKKNTHTKLETKNICQEQDSRGATAVPRRRSLGRPGSTGRGRAQGSGKAGEGSCAQPPHNAPLRPGGKITIIGGKTICLFNTLTLEKGR